MYSFSISSSGRIAPAVATGFGNVRLLTPAERRAVRERREHLLDLDEPDRYFDETLEHDGSSEIRLRTEGEEDSSHPRRSASEFDVDDSPTDSNHHGRSDALGG